MTNGEMPVLERDGIIDLLRMRELDPEHTTNLCSYEGVTSGQLFTHVEKCISQYYLVKCVRDLSFHYMHAF